ncbi:MAG: ABC transporter permease, partial [Clostridium sp.]
RQFKDIDIVDTVEDDIIYSTYHSVNMAELDSNIKLLTSEAGLQKINGGLNEYSILIKCGNNDDRISTISKLKKISLYNNYELKDTVGDKLSIEKNMKEDLGLNIIFAITVIIMVVLNLINTTNSSIMARRKELASMRAIGMSYDQQRKMIIAEIFYISLSVGITVFLSVGLLSNATLIPILAAQKVNIVTLMAGEILVIAILMLIANVSVLVPLRKTKNLNIAEDLKEE